MYKIIFVSKYDVHLYQINNSTIFQSQKTTLASLTANFMKVEVSFKTGKKQVQIFNENSELLTHTCNESRMLTGTTSEARKGIFENWIGHNSEYSETVKFEYGDFTKEFDFYPILIDISQTADDILSRFITRIETVKSWVAECKDSEKSIEGIAFSDVKEFLSDSASERKIYVKNSAGDFIAL